jgi:hypothetical protein
VEEYPLLKAERDHDLYESTVGQHKHLTHAGYPGYRRVCRVLYPISIAVAGSSLANCILDVRN